MPVLSNGRHERFAQELASGKTATEAYVLAGYKDNDGNASTMANKPEIQERIKEIKGKAAELVAEKVAVDKAWVLERLVDNVERAMQAQEIRRGAEGTGEYKYEGSVANRALELIGKELGMFVDRKEVGRPGAFSNLNDDDLDRYIAERKALIGAGAGRERAPDHQTGVRGKPNGVH